MITATFKLDEETKGALRYQEIDTDGNRVTSGLMQMGTVYLRKTALAGRRPTIIQVTAIEMD
jgi:hypothetical protein